MTISEKHTVGFLFELEELLKARKKEVPEGSYTAGLFQAGIDRILQKVGEEAVEYVIASKNNEKTAKVSEGADLLFHVIISLVEQDIPLADLVQELRERHKNK